MVVYLGDTHKERVNLEKVYIGDIVYVTFGTDYKLIMNHKDNFLYNRTIEVDAIVDGCIIPKDYNTCRIRMCDVFIVEKNITYNNLIEFRKEIETL